MTTTEQEAAGSDPVSNASVPQPMPEQDPTKMAQLERLRIEMMLAGLILLLVTMAYSYRIGVQTNLIDHNLYHVTESLKYLKANVREKERKLPSRFPDTLTVFLPILCALTSFSLLFYQAARKERFMRELAAAKREYARYSRRYDELEVALRKAEQKQRATTPSGKGVAP